MREWRESDRDAFAAIHADPEVMHDLGGPFDRAQSDAKIHRYVASFVRNGISRWAIETANGELIGYAGVLLRPDTAHPLGAHADIGWRLVRSVWGRGYACEAAEAALRDGFTRCGLSEVFAYTSPGNPRSQAVMGRLNLTRESARDFTIPETGWRGLVWTARS